MDRQQLKRTLLLGFVLGVIFGVVNLVFNWLFPLEEDTIPALLRFYGPIFFLWAFASFERRIRIGQSMMTRFRASGCDSLRTFVMLEYI